MRLDSERQEKLEPLRIEYAKKKITELGFTIVEEYSHELVILDSKGGKILFYPYSGWHTGKNIQDGRGIENLLKQLKEMKK